MCQALNLRSFQLTTSAYSTCFVVASQGTLLAILFLYLLRVSLLTTIPFSHLCHPDPFAFLLGLTEVKQQAPAQDCCPLNSIPQSSFSTTTRGGLDTPQTALILLILPFQNAPTTRTYKRASQISHNGTPQRQCRHCWQRCQQGGHRRLSAVQA